MAGAPAATATGAAPPPLVRTSISPGRTRNTGMPAAEPKAPPPRIFPGLGRADAVRVARSWQALGGVPRRVVRPPSAPTSTDTVSS
eukprot:13095891-Alexandrium_andersonii.AAC.1